MTLTLHPRREEGREANLARLHEQLASSRLDAIATVKGAIRDVEALPPDGAFCASSAPVARRSVTRRTRNPICGRKSIAAFMNRLRSLGKA